MQMQAVTPVQSSCTRLECLYAKGGPARCNDTRASVFSIQRARWSEHAHLFSQYELC